MIALVADDFTGAAEVAGICMRRGVSVSFLTGIPDPEIISALTTDVAVIAEDTRSFSKEGAEKISRLLAENLKAAGVTQIVKKIDSVMRGWVLPEMNAIASVMGYESLLIQPANTETGRSVRNGMYFIGEQLLSETAFAQDPDFPAPTSSVEKLLELRGGVSVVPYLVPDAENDEDLLHSVRLSNGNVLAGGSAAFWRVYLENQIRLGRVKSNPVERDVIGRFLLRDCLMVCGSAHQNSMDFSSRLANSGFPVLAMPETMCLEEKPSEEEYERWVGLCESVWKKERRLLVRLASRPGFPQAAETLLFRFSEAVGMLLDRIDPSQLLVEGGATAYSLLFQRQGWTSFIPEKEWLPGVVQLKLATPPGISITLKPGSYAWPAFEY